MENGLIYSFSPVCIFSYKRLDSLKQCIEKLKKCNLSEQTEVFIFNDGPKHTKDEIAINEVRNYLQSVNGFKTIELIFSTTNKGLANSIITGVTLVIEKYGSVIVLEDDLIVSPNFLEYMNKSLQFYANNPVVFSISGFSLPFKIPKNFTDDVYFLPRASSWGWASWLDRWEKIDWMITDYREFAGNKKQVKKFNEGGSDMSGMLKKQMNGAIDSWAIRWCYHQYKMKTYTAYPVISKVDNIGFTADATNTHVYNRHRTKLDLDGKYDFILPHTVFPNKKFLLQFQQFYSIKSRIIGKIKTILIWN
jgi:hypothetical protein